MIRSRKTHPVTDQEMAVVMSLPYFAIQSERQLLSEDTGRARFAIVDRTAFFQCIPSLYVEMTKKQRVTRYAAKKAAGSRLRGGPGKLSLSRSGGSESLRHPNAIITRPQLPVWVRYDECRGKIRKRERLR